MIKFSILRSVVLAASVALLLSPEALLAEDLLTPTGVSDAKVKKQCLAFVGSNNILVDGKNTLKEKMSQIANGFVSYAKDGQTRITEPGLFINSGSALADSNSEVSCVEAILSEIEIEDSNRYNALNALKGDCNDLCEKYKVPGLKNDDQYVSLSNKMFEIESYLENESKKEASAENEKIINLRNEYRSIKSRAHILFNEYLADVRSTGGSVERLTKAVDPNVSQVYAKVDEKEAMVLISLGKKKKQTSEPSKETHMQNHQQ